ASEAGETNKRAEHGSAGNHAAGEPRRNEPIEPQPARAQDEPRERSDKEAQSSGAQKENRPLPAANRRQRAVDGCLHDHSPMNRIRIAVKIVPPLARKSNYFPGPIAPEQQS